MFIDKHKTGNVTFDFIRNSLINMELKPISVVAKIVLSLSFLLIDYVFYASKYSLVFFGPVIIIYIVVMAVLSVLLPINRIYRTKYFAFLLVTCLLMFVGINLPLCYYYFVYEHYHRDILIFSYGIPLVVVVGIFIAYIISVIMFLSERKKEMCYWVIACCVIFSVFGYFLLMKLEPSVLLCIMLFLLSFLFFPKVTTTFISCCIWLFIGLLGMGAGSVVGTMNKK